MTYDDSFSDEYLSYVQAVKSVMEAHELEEIRLSSDFDGAEAQNANGSGQIAGSSNPALSPQNWYGPIAGNSQAFSPQNWWGPISGSSIALSAQNWYGPISGSSLAAAPLSWWEEE